MTDLPVFSNACVAKKSQAVTGILFNSCKKKSGSDCTFFTSSEPLYTDCENNSQHS